MPACEFHPACRHRHEHVQVLCSCGAVIAHCRCAVPAARRRTIETVAAGCPACRTAAVPRGTRSGARPGAGRARKEPEPCLP
jgi:hypothetical protein